MGGEGALFASYDEVQSGPLRGVSAPRRMISAVKMAIGTFQAMQLVRRYRPAALLLTGGWATFPTALASRLLGVPVAVFLPDIEPGLAIKWLGRLACVVYATTADSQAYFPPGKVVPTGYPLRSQVLNAKREDGIAHFELDPARRTLLIFGGSRGARSLNRTLAEILSSLLLDGLQIIHIAGETDWPEVQTRRGSLSADFQARYRAYPYLHEDMGLALAAADLVVSRAGASSLGEFPYFGLPAILVPYPFAWRYQKVNADWLAKHGAAIRLNDESLAEELLPTIRSIVTNQARWEAMRQAATALKTDGAAVIADKLLMFATE
ncbi:MAG: UDP-N-acetylglucosamine--N-acetylmuramyl-(pentapeptide) pyrophosphoryl-undecaprenol N-acetylglucosamine transferase [Aggregatilineales bacterium]